MGEPRQPRRWKLIYRGRRGVEVKRAIPSLDAGWLCQGECVRVREDRATEADVEAVGAWLRHWNFSDNGVLARELLDRVFGEKASRV